MRYRERVARALLSPSWILKNTSGLRAAPPSGGDPVVLENGIVFLSTSSILLWAGGWPLK